MLFHPGSLGSIIELESGEEWSGERLGSAIARRSAAFASQGIGPGSRVLIVHGQTAAFFVDLLATWNRGACAAVADPKLTGPELANVTDFLKPALILAGAGTCDAPGLDHGTRAQAGLDAPALVLFTSGTTGAPKGVVHSFRSIAARVALNRVHIGDEVLARTLCMLPTHFGHGLIGNALTPLLAGHDLFIARFSSDLVDVLAETLVTHRIRFVSSVPTMWRMILERTSEPSERTLARVQIGSAPLSVELWNVEPGLNSAA